MNVIRFSDLCANGQAAGQRVFIRADLNVPQAGHPHPRQCALHPDGAGSWCGRDGDQPFGPPD